jgi:hypothetical protein
LTAPHADTAPAALGTTFSTPSSTPHFSVSTALEIIAVGVSNPSHFVIGEIIMTLLRILVAGLKSKAPVMFFLKLFRFSLEG